MQYLCLRNCFTGDRFYYGGEAYELSGVHVSEKNFKLVNAEPITDEKLREPKSGEYWCNKCLSIHRVSSRLGRKHLKYK